MSFGARSDAGRSSRCSALKAYPALPTFLNVFCIRTPSRRIASSSGCASVSGSSCLLLNSAKLENGKVFDTTKDSVTGSFEFKLGKGDVIKGWDVAVATMKKGEKATVTIKPEYGYGKKSMGKIPANSTLTFEMELVDFRESGGGGCCVVS